MEQNSDTQLAYVVINMLFQYYIIFGLGWETNHSEVSLLLSKTALTVPLENIRKSAKTASALEAKDAVFTSYLT